LSPNVAKSSLPEGSSLHPDRFFCTSLPLARTRTTLPKSSSQKSPMPPIGTFRPSWRRPTMCAIEPEADPWLNALIAAFDPKQS